MEIDQPLTDNSLDTLVDDMKQMSINDTNVFMTIFSDLWKTDPNIVINAVLIRNNPRSEIYEIKFNKQHESKLQQYIVNYNINSKGNVIGYKKDFNYKSSYYNKYVLLINKK